MHFHKAFTSSRFWFVFSTALMLILSILDQSLHTAQAPFGIISFEFHGLASKPWTLDWNTQQRGLAGFQLGLDFLFILAYSTFLWTCSNTSRQKKRYYIQTCIAAAALMDVIENIFLMYVLWNGVTQEWISLTASLCACVKFLLIILSLILIDWPKSSLLTKRHNSN